MGLPAHVAVAPAPPGARLPDCRRAVVRGEHVRRSVVWSAALGSRDHYDSLKVAAASGTVTEGCCRRFD